MANTVPFRLEIIKRMQALIGTVSTAQGYSTTIDPNSVFRGRKYFGENDPLPMFVILEIPIPQEQLPLPPGNPFRMTIWELMVQGFMEDDPKFPTDQGYYYSSDIFCVFNRHKLEKQSYAKLGFGDQANTVEDIYIGEPKVVPPDEISAKAYFWLPISLKLHENLASPLDYRSS